MPQENWNYTHPFVSDFTPYYFAGSRTQMVDPTGTTTYSGTGTSASPNGLEIA